MSQVFSADGQYNNNNVVIVGGAETAVASTNFISPPFQNAKAIIIGSARVSAGTSTTSISLNVRRNPNAENFLVVNNASVAVVPGTIYMFNWLGIDVIPDGRPVQYSITVTQAGASANGTAYQPTVAAWLISG